MSVVCYYASGFARSSTPQDPRYGASVLQVANPTPFETRLSITLYYEDRAPAQVPEQVLKPYQSGFGCYFEEQFMDLFFNVNGYGARLISDVPLVVHHLVTCGVKGQREQFGLQEAWEFAAERATTEPAHVWYFPGTSVEVYAPGEAPFYAPFNQTDWYHILNPNDKPTQVTMRVRFDDGEQFCHRLDVPSERVHVLDITNILPVNRHGSLRFDSSEPVVIAGERMRYDQENLAGWGMHIHHNKPGIASPLLYNEFHMGCTL
ncbi:MAG: hypothetical protein ACUVX9_10210 [Anaerolineae bacterium]